MKKLINKENEDNVFIQIDKERLFSSPEGFCFVKLEYLNFGLEKKLNELINRTSNLLKYLELNHYNAQINLINSLNKKHNTLKEYIKKLKEIKKSYITNLYYYIDVIDFYRHKYEDTPIIYFEERKKYKNLNIHAQILSKECFNDFYKEYCALKKSYEEDKQIISEFENKFNINI